MYLVPPLVYHIKKEKTSVDQLVDNSHLATIMRIPVISILLWLMSNQATCNRHSGRFRSPSFSWTNWRAMFSSGHGFGHHSVSSSKPSSTPAQSSESVQPRGRGNRALWSEVVPAKLSSAPAEVASLRWPGSSVSLNMTMITGQMKDRPTLSWSADRSSLYTVVIVDEGVASLNGMQYIHWIMINIPGNDILSGTEVMRYIEPFAASPDDSEHPMLVLVYKQNDGKVEFEETQRGCSTSLLTSRVNDKDALAAKYNLELVAGTFFLVPYSGRATEEMLCYYSRCTRGAFPPPIPGVTDRPECQPNTEVFDVTLRGPKLDRLAEYGQGLSLLNPDSLMSAIRDSKSVGISTGVIKETQAYGGVLGNNRASPVSNLNQTLQGQVNPAYLTYQSREGANRLFSALGDPTPVFSTFAGDAPLHITFSEPDDLDFDLSRLLNTPGEVVWVTLANVTDANRAKHLEIREQLFSKMIQRPFVREFYKFNIWREGETGYDNSMVELLIYVSRSREDQAAFFGGLPQSFLSGFWDTFVCLACMATDTQLGAEYFPPFPNQPK